MSKIQDVRLVSDTSGCSRITFLAENLTTGITGLFSIKMAVPNEGISYGIGTLKGRVKESQYNTDCNGEGIGLTTGNTTYTEGSLSITFGDAYNQRISIDPTICRNLVIAVLQGGTFTVGGVTYSVVGTNGTRNLGSLSNSLDHKYFFLDEGKVISPDEKNADGTMVTVANDFITAYPKNNPVAMEFLYAFSDAEKKGDRFAYVLATDPTFTAGSGADYNRYEVPATRYCDPKSIDKYLIDGLTNPQVFATTGADSIYRVEADIIIEVSGGGTPTVAGVSGDQAIVVDSDDNTVEAFIHNGTTWIATPVTSTLGQGCVIHSNSYDTALDGATAVAGSVYVAIKTAGTTGNAVAVDTKTGTSGSGTSTTILKAYDWVYSSQGFVAYTGTEL